METATDKPVDDAGDSRPNLPIGYRLLFWGVVLELCGLTAYVWIVAFRAASLAGAGYGIPYSEFGRLLVGYHLLFIFWLCLAWLTQLVWRMMGTLGLLPLALVISAGSLHIAVFQLCWMLQGFGE